MRVRLLADAFLLIGALKNVHHESERCQFLSSNNINRISWLISRGLPRKHNINGPLSTLKELHTLKAEVI